MSGDNYNFDKWVWDWPFKNLNKRFLNSDFLANYSRGYVWAANQLGHFTLGLIVALGYFWFSDTLFRTFAGIRGYQYSSNGAHHPPAATYDSMMLQAPHSLAMVLGVGILVSLPYLFYRIATKKMRFHSVHKDREDRRLDAKDIGFELDERDLALLSVTKGRLLRERIERFGVLIGLLLVAAATIAVIYVSYSQNIEGAFRWRAYAGSVMATTLFFAMMAALLSQSPRYTLLSWTVLAAAAIMWEPRTLDIAAIGSPLPVPEWLRFFSDRPLIILLAALFLVQISFLRVRDSYGRAPIWVIGVIGVFFLLGATVEDPEWSRAIAAAFASLGIWWVKEFGADLPTVEVELDDAHCARAVHGHCAFNGVDPVEDFAEARRECFDDTLCDARTDGAFYLAGAALAIGLLASPSLIDAEASRVLISLGGVLLFLLLYWTIGWSWIRRSIALDRVLVLAAQRFAMLESAMVTRLMVGDHEANPETAAETPRGSVQRLRAFARGELTVKGRPVRHMIICGQFGSGRSALGHAVACEAALATAPPWSSAAERKTKSPLRWARYLTIRGVFERYVFNSHSRAQDEKELWERIGAPDIFVIDQADPFAQETIAAFQTWSEQNPEPTHYQTLCDLHDCAQRPREQIVGSPGSARARLLEAVMGLLHVDIKKRRDGKEANDQTVWIIYADAPPPSPGQAWAPEIPEMARQYAADLRAAIAARSDDELNADEIPVAIVTVGRPHRPAGAPKPRYQGRGADSDRELLADAAGA